MADHQKRAVSAKEIARLEKQRKLAQTLRLKEEAEANGEDMERKKAWEWTIEQDERWKKKLDEREEKGDSSYHSMSVSPVCWTIIEKKEVSWRCTVRKQTVWQSVTF